MRTRNATGLCRPSTRAKAFVHGVAIALCIARPLCAQGAVLLQGVADGEAWFTSGTSNLLTRNGGKPAELGRINLWGAYQPLGNVVMYAQMRAETGSAQAEKWGSDFDVEQFGIRYISSRAFVADVGRLAPVVGAFAARRLSTRNPLIGLPDVYSLEYPYGAELTGETRHFDYRVAAVSLPSYHDGYVPQPTARLRPALGAGFTPVIGLHFGASYTQGSYLNEGFAPGQLAGQAWSSYGQRVLGLDFSYAVGYLETRVEFSRGSYEVPGRAARLTGTAYYGEMKYTFTPRLFVAVRAERNDYPFIRPLTASWVAKLTDFEDGEAGVGYRVTASTLVKMSVRGDRWWVSRYASGFLGQGGGALAFQVSQSFDVLSWFQGER